MKSKNVLSPVVNLCGKIVVESQEHLSQLHKCRVIRKAWVSVDDSLAAKSLLNIMSFFHLVSGTEIYNTEDKKVLYCNQKRL